MSKTLKPKRLNLSMTEELFNEISVEAEKQNLSLSAYCIQAIEKSLGKVQKIDPRLITIEPVDIYTDDIREGLSKIGNTASKLDRMLYTLSHKEGVAEYELKRLADLTTQLKEEEKEFNQTLLRAYEERVNLKKAILKKIDKIVKKVISVNQPKSDLRKTEQKEEEGGQ